MHTESTEGIPADSGLAEEFFIKSAYSANLPISDRAKGRTFSPNRSNPYVNVSRLYLMAAHRRREVQRSSLLTMHCHSLSITQVTFSHTNSTFGWAIHMPLILPSSCPFCTLTLYCRTICTIAMRIMISARYLPRHIRGPKPKRQ